MRHRPSLRALLHLAAVVWIPVACHSAGPYGHARHYVPLSAEDAAAEGAVRYDPVMARRSPDAWRNRKVSVFGVVLSRQKKASAGGATAVELSVRKLEPRNLCETASEDSCRVTVSDREHARVRARLHLRPDDDTGAHRLGQRSLVRVIGRLDDMAASNGQPVIAAEYYRHWPRDFYVTTSARRYMRR